MSISIITTIKRLSAHLTHKRLLPRVYSSVFLEVLRIHKCRLTHTTFIRSFPSMRRLYMIIQQSPPLETLTTILAFVTFIVIMGSPFMRLQIGSLTESSATKLALIGSFTGVGSFMVAYFCFSCKRLATQTTNEWFVTGVYN